MNTTHSDVQEYYGKKLQTSDDLKTDACCTPAQQPKYITDILSSIADEVLIKYYGCGLTIPTAIEGLKVLDLGSGSGRDCFVASKLVGERGYVVGVDMTEEQLDVSNKYIDYHRSKFDYSVSNVEFLKGNIEELDGLKLKKESFDLIISNCVINLAVDKYKVLKDVYDLLKPGGEMFFSDIYADRRIPESLQQNKLLWGECLSGSLYWNDFLNIAKKAGFSDPRSVDNHLLNIDNGELKELVGDVKFYSVTYRLIKLEGLESDCEDYGQAVVYSGGIEENKSGFKLDDHHYFPKGKMIAVCGNTYKMLNETRFKEYFEFHGTWDTHFGIFEGCGGNMPFSSDESVETSCC